MTLLVNIFSYATDHNRQNSFADHKLRCNKLSHHHNPNMSFHKEILLRYLLHTPIPDPNQELVNIRWDPDGSNHKPTF